jgi:hypothetical protein
MKTSLNIEDSLFEAAKKEAERTGKTLSETISTWAREGRRLVARQQRERRPTPPVDLGGSATVDINSRRDWMDALDG